MAFDDFLDDVQSVLADPAGQHDGRTVDELRVAPNIVDRQIALPQVEHAPQLRLRLLGEPGVREPDRKDLHAALVIGHACREPERPSLRKAPPVADCLTSVASRSQSRSDANRAEFASGSKRAVPFEPRPPTAG